jgi:prepilin-type N-terminal cleavage/methylation domain-containing protein
MKTQKTFISRGFTLIETVVAIGVLAVLLTGFVVVFAPAAEGVKKSINVEEADRLASTLEQELVTPRGGQPTPGFNKAFEWIKASNTPNTALLAYQYRGSLASLRSDGTPEPVANESGNSPGSDYAVLSMVRRKNDPEFLVDLPAIVGGVYVVKCNQLTFTTSGELKPKTDGKIYDAKGVTESTSADTHPEAIIPFAANFYSLTGKSAGMFQSGFDARFNKLGSPVLPTFTRNLAVRR